MKKQNFLEWMQDEINDIERYGNYKGNEEWKTLGYIKRKVESGDFDD